MKNVEKGLQFRPDKCRTMNITRNAPFVENYLFIDYRSESHNEEDQIIDTFKGKQKKKTVSEQKYLAFMISEDGSNIKNI